MTMLGRCCLCEPPIPFVGFIRRYMQATAIADYNSLSNATYTSQQLYSEVARNFSTGTSYYGGQLLNCLTYTLEIPASATGRQSKILQPIRLTLDETSSNGGNFDYWRNPSGQTNDVGDFRAQDSQYQLFASDELLPVSGNSHVDNSDPHTFEMSTSVTNAYHHMWQQAAGYEWTGLQFLPPLPQNYGVRPRYIQIRKNGSAYGSIYDLEDFNDAYESQTGLLNYRALNSLLRYYLLFPSASPQWTAFGYLFNNWNFQFADGDLIDLDVWLEVVADPDSGQTATKYVPISIGIDEDTSGSHQASDYSTSWIPSGAVLQARSPLNGSRLQISGLDVSVGYAPSTDTYTYTPDNGTAVMGKAVGTDGTFSTDSGSLTWQFTRTIAGSPEPGVGSSTWSSDNGDPWELVADNCTIGEPTEPTDPLPTPTDPPSSTLAFGGCEVPAEDRTLTVYLLHVWREEMCYLKIDWQLSATTYDPSEQGFTLYRPRNATPTPDYASTVYSRRDGGNLIIGPAGCFDHLGTTVFDLAALVDKVQDGTSYDNEHGDLPTTLQGIVPTSITVTHSTQ